MEESSSIDKLNVLLALILATIAFANGNVLPKITEHRRPPTTTCRSGRDCNRLPNFVFLLTDDQDLLLNGEIGMQYTKDMMLRKGIFVDNFFANTPLCCPSRATLFSGRYAHNWHTSGYEGTCMHMDLSEEFWATNIGVTMQELGYTTGAFGKLTNLEPLFGTPFCNESLVVPIPGFNSTLALCTELVYYNNTWNVNGTLIETGDTPDDYMTSVIGNETIEFLVASLQAGRPFFAYVGPHAPHQPATPAPWYENAFSGYEAPRTQSYNYSAPDHHYIVRSQPPLLGEDSDQVDGLFRNRTRTLLSVDDIMKSVVHTLTEYDQLDNTYIVWTSDHGYQLGQFCLPGGKMEPYEHVIRVPFYIRGPSIPQGVSLPFVASMVDVAPTLIQLANGQTPSYMDGHSFKNQLKFAPSLRERHLIEHWSPPMPLTYLDHYISFQNNTFFGVRLLNRTHNFMYAEFYENDIEIRAKNPFEYELFDLSSDPSQMTNVYKDFRQRRLVEELHNYLQEQVKCKGQVQCKL